MAGCRRKSDRTDTLFISWGFSFYTSLPNNLQIFVFAKVWIFIGLGEKQVVAGVGLGLFEGGRQEVGCAWFRLWGLGAFLCFHWLALLCWSFYF